MNCYFARGRINTDAERGEPLHVNNCGFYKDLDTPLRIVRERGRRDYQLIVCVNGRIDVNGKKLESGDAYLFYPNAVQSYCYHPMEGSYYCWVHFSGTEAERILKKADLLEGFHPCRAHISEVESLLRMLMTFLQTGASTAEEFGTGLLFSILMLLPNANATKSPFSHAVRRLEDLEHPVRIEELAAHYRMSTAHFIRLFRAYFGVPPKHYRKEKQIELAKMLLLDSPLSISQIAVRVGVEDPLYFSRMFRSSVGIPPNEFRKKSLESI